MMFLFFNFTVDADSREKMSACYLRSPGNDMQRGGNEEYPQYFAVYSAGLSAKSLANQTDIVMIVRRTWLVTSIA